MALLDDIGTHLTTAGVVGGATGWVLSKGYMPPTPDQVLAVFETPGEPPEVGKGDATVYDYPGFQVRVRGAKFGYSAARAKLQDVFDALHAREPSGYVYVYAAGSGPLPLGNDAQQRPELTQNYRAMAARS